MVELDQQKSGNITKTLWYNPVTHGVFVEVATPDYQETFECDPATAWDEFIHACARVHLTEV